MDSKFRKICVLLVLFFSIVQFIINTVNNNSEAQSGWTVSILMCFYILLSYLEQKKLKKGRDN